MTCAGVFPTKAAKRRDHRRFNPSAQFYFKPARVINSFWSGITTAQTVEHHALTVYLASFGAQGRGPISIKQHFLGVRGISCQILPVVRYSRCLCCSPEHLFKQHLSDPQMTATIIPPPGCWYCVSHQQSHVVISWYIVVTFRVSEKQRFKSEAHLTLVMRPKDLLTFGFIPVL